MSLYRSSRFRAAVDDDDSFRCESPKSVRDAPQSRRSLLQRRIAQYKVSLSTESDINPYTSCDESSTASGSSWSIKNRFRKAVTGKVLMGSRRSSLLDWSMDFQKSRGRPSTADDDDNDGDYEDALSEFCDDDSSTTSSCDTPPDSGSGKRVRFQLKSNGMIKAEKVSSSPLKLTEEEIERLWWTKKERREMKRRTNAMAVSFISSEADFRSAMEQLLLKCVDENGQKIHYAEPKGDRVDPFTYEEAVRIAVHHEARGLEQAMVNSLNLQSCRFYYRCGQTSVATVLKAQAALRELEGVTADGQASLIAINLRQCSGFAVQFAQILAEGDAKVANGDYDDESSTSSLSSECSSSDNNANPELEEPNDENDFLLNQLCQL